MLKEIKRNYSYYLFSFFFVSISAWFFEVLYSLIFRSKLVNPGTLLGAWCPIYGISFVCFLLLISNKDNRLFNMLKIFIIAFVVEYAASYISGEIFNNVIWDYSNELFNINGRVCLKMTLLFTVAGYFCIYLIEPWLRRIYIKIGRKVKYLNIILIFLFCLDILCNIFIV